MTRRSDGKLVGRIATIWDTPGDAAEFAVASVAARFPGADPRHSEVGIARPDGGRVFVRTAGAKVFIVDGAVDAAALDARVLPAKVREGRPPS